MRKAAVGWAEWLARERVPAGAVRSWQAIAANLGLTGGGLAAGLAPTLEQRGTLEATRSHWERAVAGLQANTAGCRLRRRNCPEGATG